jgi:hypothetical protein
MRFDEFYGSKFDFFFLATFGRHFETGGNEKNSPAIIFFFIIYWKKNPLNQFFFQTWKEIRETILAGPNCIYFNYYPKDDPFRLL